MPQLLEASQLPGLLRPGMTVFLTGGVNEPRELTAALAAAPEACAGVHFVATLLPGLPAFAPPGESRLTTFFMAPDLQPAAKQGRVDFVPMQYRDTWDYLEELAPDLVLTQVAPEAGGQCSFGLAVDFLPALLEQAGQIVVETNRALPSPPGAPTLPWSRVDFAVESERPFPCQEPTRSDEATAIGLYVASLVRDGDCLQTGIGAIPGAVLAALDGKTDLGFHSGMLGDEVLDLIGAGVLTGARKSRDRHRHTTGFVYGSERLYAWAAAAPSLDFRPVQFTHDMRILAEIDDFVAVNSAVEVDLFGQVNAEMVGGRQVSGTGGSVDFFRGAARSRGGRSIVALPATARRGSTSRIVPALETGTAATALRTDVDHVVTEHGVASLRGRPVEARAEALIAVAAPEFRDSLLDAWKNRAS